MKTLFALFTYTFWKDVIVRELGPENKVESKRGNWIEIFFMMIILLQHTQMYKSTSDFYSSSLTFKMHWTFLIKPCWS